MKQLNFLETKKYFTGKRVAVVGSGPGVLDNKPGYIDDHDVVVRVSNYKTEGLENTTGQRTDVLYSFFGSSAAKKRPKDYIHDGVKLCMCKCPDAELDYKSNWHMRRNKKHGTDYRMIYRRRAGFWFCPVYVPTLGRFMEYFRLLGNHIPTTGFSCLLDVFDFECQEIYVTGFDFFQSGIHNVTDRWRPKNPDDPIRHMPDLELKYFTEKRPRNVLMDARLKKIVKRG